MSKRLLMLAGLLLLVVFCYSWWGRVRWVSGRDPYLLSASFPYPDRVLRVWAAWLDDVPPAGPGLIQLAPPSFHGVPYYLLHIQMISCVGLLLIGVIGTGGWMWRRLRRGEGFPVELREGGGQG